MILVDFKYYVKYPYPYLGDKLVLERKKNLPWWYSFETVKKIVQSIGRSIRSSDDYATTYILDTGWERFYYDNIKLFPKNFEKYFN